MPSRPPLPACPNVCRQRLPTSARPVHTWPCNDNETHRGAAATLRELSAPLRELSATRRELSTAATLRELAATRRAPSNTLRKLGAPRRPRPKSA
eukprot:350997-Chlamydomonas_euryale.AAC.1